MLTVIAGAARRAAGGVVLALMFLIPTRAEAQFTTTTQATCVGGAIGCTQMDFFIDFLNLAGPTTLDAFTLALANPQFAFASPGTTEAEDALGLNFYDPTVSADGLTLTGVFDFGAFLDPSITSTLRVRAEMMSIPPNITDASSMGYDYEVAAGGQTVASGSFEPAPPVTSTPEPGTLLLFGTGLGGIVGLTRRRGRVAS